MTRSVDAATSAAYQTRGGHVPRYFVWIVAKDRETGAEASIGLWNGDDTVDETVIRAETGKAETRTYHAAGALISHDPIPAVSDLSVRTIKVTLSQINAAVQQAVRGYDARLARVEIHRGLLSIESRLLVAPPVSIFDGQVNGAPIETPTAGQEGSVSLSVVSHTRMLTRTNPQKRSDETQKLRSGDRFRRHSGVAGQWDFSWGEHRGTTG